MNAEAPPADYGWRFARRMESSAVPAPSGASGPTARSAATARSATTGRPAYGTTATRAASASASRRASAAGAACARSSRGASTAGAASASASRRASAASAAAPARRPTSRASSAGCRVGRVALGDGFTEALGALLEVSAVAHALLELEGRTGIAQQLAQWDVVKFISHFPFSTVGTSHEGPPRIRIAMRVLLAGQGIIWLRRCSPHDRREMAAEDVTMRGGSPSPALPPRLRHAQIATEDRALRRNRIAGFPSAPHHVTAPAWPPVERDRARRRRGGSGR